MLQPDAKQLWRRYCKNGHDLLEPYSTYAMSNGVLRCAFCDRDWRKKYYNSGQSSNPKNRKRPRQHIGPRQFCAKGHDKTLPGGAYVGINGRLACRLCKLEYAARYREEQRQRLLRNHDGTEAVQDHFA